MGQIVKQVTAHTTRYYWYPGDRREWIRGASAVFLGIAGFFLLRALIHDALLAAVIGTSLTAALAGLNFGRRDSRELACFGAVAVKAARARRQAVVHTGRAVWRGFAMGTGGAAAAILIVNMSAHGLVADWLLPLVPAVVGALAHQIGMLYERLGSTKSTEGPAKGKTAEPIVPAAGTPASVVPATLAPTWVAPTSGAPASGAPGSAVPLSVAPASAAPVSPVPGAPVPGAPAGSAPEAGAAASSMKTPVVTTAGAATATVGDAPSGAGSDPAEAPAATVAVAPESAAGPAAAPAAVKRHTALLAPPMVANGLVPAKAARKVLPPMPASLALLELAEAVKAEAAQARREVGGDRRGPGDGPPAPTAPSPAASTPAGPALAPVPVGPGATTAPVPVGPGATAAPAPVGPGATAAPAPVGPGATGAPAPVGPEAVGGLVKLAVTRTVPAAPVSPVAGGPVEWQTIDGDTGAPHPHPLGGRHVGRAKVAA